MTMSVSIHVQKLRRILTDTSQLIETIDTSRDLSADDEFETEYLLENISKTLKKLQRIAKVYEKVPNVSSRTTPPDGASVTISEKVSRMSHEVKGAPSSRRTFDAGNKFDEDMSADETVDINDDELDDSLNNVRPIHKHQVGQVYMKSYYILINETWKNNIKIKYYPVLFNLLSTVP